MATFPEPSRVTPPAEGSAFHLMLLDPKTPGDLVRLMHQRLGQPLAGKNDSVSLLGGPFLDALDQLGQEGAVTEWVSAAVRLEPDGQHLCQFALLALNDRQPGSRPRAIQAPMGSGKPGP